AATAAHRLRAFTVCLSCLELGELRGYHCGPRRASAGRRTMPNRKATPTRPKSATRIPTPAARGSPPPPPMTVWALSSLYFVVVATGVGDGLLLPAIGVVPPVCAGVGSAAGVPVVAGAAAWFVTVLLCGDEAVVLLLFEACDEVDVFDALD